MPKSKPQVIEELYVVIGKGAKGNEGVVTYIDPDDKIMKPLVGGRPRVPVLIQVGKALANTSGKELRLVKFSTRDNLEVLSPEAHEKP